MELDEFDFQKAVEDGMDIVIVYPADNKAKGTKAGDPSDMKIKVKGVGSEAFKKGIAVFNAYLEKCKKEDTNPDEEEKRKNTAKMLSMCCEGWEGVKVGGKDVKFSQDKAYDLFIKHEWLAGQVAAAVMDVDTMLEKNCQAS